MVTEARTVLAASARRGSTDEERTAAETWLGNRCETSSHASGVSTNDRTSIDENDVEPSKPIEERLATRVGAALAVATGGGAGERQQQRILHRTEVIDCVLVAEQRNGATLTLGDAPNS